MHHFPAFAHSRRLLFRFGLRLAICTLLFAAVVGPAQMAAAATPPADSSFFPSTGYGVSDAQILTYFQRHGGVRSLGYPISNSFRLLGSRVQIFQRQAIEVRPDGSTGTIGLVDGYLPIAALGGPGMAPDPALLSALPAAVSAESSLRASADLDRLAPNDWNGLPVRFAAAYRSSVRCQDVVRVSPCNGNIAFGLAAELWGLPIGHPSADPHTSEYVYLTLQRGVLVYSRTAGDTQLLLVGQLFKQVLLGGELPPDMLAQISASPAYARFYAQYDTLAPDGVARPSELPGTAFSGAFAPAAGPGTTLPATATVPSAASLATSALPKLDPHFGVAEGFRSPSTMADIRAGWERVVLPWDQIQPVGPGDFSHLGLSLPAEQLSAELARGVQVAGVLQFTPGWAQSDPSAGQRSTPKNLYLAYDDPNNYWGRYVFETVHFYSGQIDEWLVWNEPDFRPTDPGGAWSWAGSDEDFAQLLKVGYLAAKKANPKAIVAFPATSYWTDEQSNPTRAPFYDRLLSLLDGDPQAATHNVYHDAVALNLYRSADDVYRVHDIFAALQRKHGIDKPIWLTEMNAAPTEDAPNPCAGRQPSSPIKTTLDQQAAYTVQAFALGAAAGYQHIEFYEMSDNQSCTEPAWGLVRADGTRRPVADAARTAIAYFSNFTRAHFAPLARDQEHWSAWPANPASYIPNWQVYQVAFDRKHDQRVTVLWNGDGTPLRVQIPRSGVSARLVDTHGAERLLQDTEGSWIVDLPPATAQYKLDEQNKDPDGYHFIGGDPVLIVEEGVDPSTPVIAPRARSV